MTRLHLKQKKLLLKFLGLTMVLLQFTNVHHFHSALVDYSEVFDSHHSEAALFLEVEKPRRTAPQCTREDLLKIRSHLDPSKCLSNVEPYRPWLQKCSITGATKCPDSRNWLDEYYAELQQKYIAAAAENSFGHNIPPFVGMSLGYNNGIEALDTLRMGTFNPHLNVKFWANITGDVGKSKKHDATCRRHIINGLQPFDSDMKVRRGEMLCFELVQSTRDRLSSHSKKLGRHGFKVVPSVMSEEKDNDNGDSADILSLGTYLEKKNYTDGPIHILQMNLDGFDGDALLGAGIQVLRRVEYLEFEYNWMGSWSKQHLYDIIQMLDKANLSCYWAGKKRLWRITECWMLYYDVHFWSNVACVNREKVPRLAEKMEAVFQETLAENKTLPDFDESKHEILSTDQAKMTSFYLSKE